VGASVSTNSEPEQGPNCHYDTKPQDRQGGSVDRLPVSSLRFSSVPSEKTYRNQTTVALFSSHLSNNRRYFQSYWQRCQMKYKSVNKWLLTPQFTFKTPPFDPTGELSFINKLLYSESHRTTCQQTSFPSYQSGPYKLRLLRSDGQFVLPPTFSIHFNFTTISPERKD
jgi:hypothetical protein